MCSAFINQHGRETYKEGRSQRLKREEANDRNQDKKAIIADNRYLLQRFAWQKDGPAPIRTLVALAVEQAADSVK